MRILLLALSLVAAGLYVKILLPPDYALPGLAEVEQTLLGEGGEAPAEGNLREVPESQMQVIREVFAPELGAAD